MVNEESEMKALAYLTLIEDGKIMIRARMEGAPAALCRLGFL